MNRKNKIGALVSSLLYTCACGKMTNDSLHIGLNRFLLLIVGLWPYRQSILVQFQLILLFSVLMTFILVQVSSTILVVYTTIFVVFYIKKNIYI